MDKINLQLTFKTALTLAAPVVLSWGEFNELSVETMSLDPFFSPKVKFGVFPLMHINQNSKETYMLLTSSVEIMALDKDTPSYSYTRSVQSKANSSRKSKQTLNC